MALWRWKRWRWEKVRALPGYYPPDFLRIRRFRRSGKELWEIESPEIPLHGADHLPEALEALIRSCRRPRGDGGLWKLEDEEFRRVEEIEAFPEEAVWGHGLYLRRLDRPPDRWLLALELARPVKGLYVSRWERYLAVWDVALSALLSAVKRKGPEG